MCATPGVQDPSTLELLDSLLTVPNGRLLVVLTGRDGDWLRTQCPVKLFELAPLSDEQSDAPIDALDPAVSDAQRAAVRRRCDGVPFYIEHVVAGLDGAGHEPQVPEALYELLFARLHHAHADVVPVVEAAAAGAVLGASTRAFRSIWGNGEVRADLDVADVRRHPLIPLLATHVRSQLVTQIIWARHRRPQT